MTDAELKTWATEEDACFHHGPSTAQAVLALFARAEAAEAKLGEVERLAMALETETAQQVDPALHPFIAGRSNAASEIAASLRAALAAGQHP